MAAEEETRHVFIGFQYKHFKNLKKKLVLLLEFEFDQNSNLFRQCLMPPGGDGWTWKHIYIKKNKERISFYRPFKIIRILFLKTALLFSIREVGRPFAMCLKCSNYTQCTTCHWHWFFQVEPFQSPAFNGLVPAWALQQFWGWRRCDTDHTTGKRMAPQQMRSTRNRTSFHRLYSLEPSSVDSMMM